MARIFCTDLAVERGEPLEGWGGGADRYFFVKWPRGKWRSPRYDTVDLGEAFPEAMRQWIGNGRHIGFVDGELGETMQVFTFPDNLTRTVGSLEELTAVLTAWGEGNAIVGTPIGKRVIICCTDAKTDACCAKYGFSTYKAVVAAADAERHTVFQCTHIGGCHLAPSMMVMDTRDRYGRMLPVEAPDFIAALDRGDYYLPRFKGRADDSRVAQVVHISAMRWAAEHAIDQSAIVVDPDMAEPEDSALSVLVPTPAGPLTVRLARRTFEIHGHCDAIPEGQGEMEDLWVLESATLQAVPRTEHDTGAL